jgi:hypothetical protein
LRNDIPFLAHTMSPRRLSTGKLWMGMGAPAPDGA